MLFKHGLSFPFMFTHMYVYMSAFGHMLRITIVIELPFELCWEIVGSLKVRTLKVICSPRSDGRHVELSGFES